jgi:colanic acid/amylovoran biosynthesis protein
MGASVVGALEPIKDACMVDGKKSIILLGAGFSTPNMGVWALASGAIASALHSFPDAKIYLLDYDKEPARYAVKHPNGTTDVELINIRFSKKLFLQNNIARLILTALILRLVPSRRLRDSIINRNPYLKAVNQADIIGSIAGGDSFSDIYGLARLIYVSLPQILVFLMGKPLVLLPQTLGPFKSVFAKAIARYIVRRAQRVYSRDDEGLSTASELIGEGHGKVQFCYDMGFALEPQIAEWRIPLELAELDHNIPLVGLNISGLLIMGGYTRRNMFSLKTDYRELIDGMIEHFVREYHAHVMLVPHVFGKGEDSESDVDACREIYRDTKNPLQRNLHLIEGEYDQHEIKALIGRCDFFLGSRMHSCIGALSQCVPAIGLAYSKKFLGVFKSIGMENLAVDLRKNDQNSVIEIVDRAYDKRAELGIQLKRKMPEVRESVMNIFTMNHSRTE